MSDLEEDDSVIYQTLGGETTSTASGSENSAERYLKLELKTNSTYLRPVFLTALCTVAMASAKPE